MSDKKLPPPPKTIEITNFAGRLTRIINGDLNSGFANFKNSWGYDPFSKPGNLTWLEQPTDITGTAITDLVLAAVARSENGQLYIYAVGSAGRLYKIQPNSISSPTVDSVVGVFSASVSGTTYNYGASMALFNYATASTIGKIYVGGDNQVVKVNTDGTGASAISAGAGYVVNRYRPLVQFAGKLLFGNGNTIAAIDNTDTVISTINNPSSIYSQLNPLLPPETYVTDLDVSTDGNYAIIASSGTLNEQPTNYGATVDGNLQPANAVSGNLYLWNGSDQAATASNQMGKFSINALQAYFQNNMIFINDSFGSSINNGTQKLITMTGNKSPFANGTDVNGNFLTWVTVESTDGTSLVASLYYFGQLDEETPQGLYRILRYSTSLSNGFVAQAPFNMMINSASVGLNTSASVVSQFGYGKHYFSTLEANTSTAAKFTLQRILVPSSGSGVSQFGFYETQTQLFSRKITVKQVRVYTEPTVAGNSFILKLIGSDGNFMRDSNMGLGGYFQYTYAGGTDITKLQGALDRIDYNPSIQNTYALGLQIQNFGNANMTIHKIEIDYEQSGR